LDAVSPTQRFIQSGHGSDHGIPGIAGSHEPAAIVLLAIAAALASLHRWALSFVSPFESLSSNLE
jgi:hypothetical protein